MGRMEDALKKAAEERERQRAASNPSPVTAPAETGAPTTAATMAPGPSTGPLFNGQTDERIVLVSDPQSVRAEEFRRLRANVVALNPRPSIIAIASAADEDGGDVIVANLAVALAEARMGQVLLVDGDLRIGGASRLLGVRGDAGLSEAMIGAGAIRPISSAIPNLDVVTAGSRGLDATRQIRPGILKEVLASVAPRYAFCLVSVPAIDGFADGRVLAADTEGVILVTRIGGSERTSLKRAYDALAASRARVLGTVAFGG